MLVYEAMNRARSRPALDGQPSRHDGIDLVRLLMAFAVVLLHALPKPVDTPGGAPWVILLATACRAAVPFFFVAAGYFMRPPSSLRWSVVQRPLLRVVPAFLVWVALYHAASVVLGVPARAMRWTDLFSGGLAFHLWFLPALAAAMILVTAGIAVLGRRWTRVLCCVLAACALAVGSYHLLSGLRERPLIAGFCGAEAWRTEGQRPAPASRSRSRVAEFLPRSS
jgi:surface polysaccharide O-acyltransferase-like enzyme